MTDIDRRDFLAGVLGSAALLGGGGLPQLARTMARFGSSETALAVVSRKNVYCLRATSADIVAYRNAITAMRARPATDPTSWLAQANIHGSYAPPPGMITGVCEHSSGFVNRFFVSWHRIYLHYFERIIRASSGNPTFALPYWGYSPIGTGPRDLPAIFRDPTNLPELYVSQRNTGVNAGNPLSPSLVDSGAAMTPLTFGGWSGFSIALESTPHGDVHSAVGSTPTTAGPSVDGWMGTFEEAGQDPIFWLHHANIDRLWSVWIGSGGGRANPADAAWLNHSWNFYDETGAQVSMTGAQVLDTATQLGYSYATTTCPRVPNIYPDTRLRWLDPRVIELLRRLRIRKPWPPPPPPPFAQQARISLGSSPVEISLAVSAEGQKVLQRFPTAGGQGTQLALVFSDIHLQAPASVFYEVYINLRGSPGAAEYTNPGYAGNISFFGPSRRGRNKDMGLSRTINLIPAFALLSAAGLWRNDVVRVTLVPKGVTENQRPDRVLGNRIQATVGRVELRIE